MRSHGPAAGHDRLKTSADPTGTKVFGMLNNCAGGDALGHVLISEENFNGYFGGGSRGHAGGRQLQALRHPPRRATTMARIVDRFDLAKEPNEPNRFGWMVENDPYDATSPGEADGARPLQARGCYQPRQQGRPLRLLLRRRRALRLRLQVRHRTDARPGDRAANRDLLDNGTSTSRDSTPTDVDWLPLVHGQGPLTAANGFRARPTC